MEGFEQSLRGFVLLLLRFGHFERVFGVLGLLKVVEVVGLSLVVWFCLCVKIVQNRRKHITYYVVI